MLNKLGKNVINTAFSANLLQNRIVLEPYCIVSVLHSTVLDRIILKHTLDWLNHTRLNLTSTMLWSSTVKVSTDMVRLGTGTIRYLTDTVLVRCSIVRKSYGFWNKFA